jgi:hypothetical protein
MKNSSEKKTEMYTDFETLVCKLGLCKADHCPYCKSCLKGEPIPNKWMDKGYYGDETHYSRLIAIQDTIRDRVVRHQCPDCNASWHV